MTLIGTLVTKFTADMTGLKEGIAQYGRELKEAEQKNEEFNRGLDAIITTAAGVVGAVIAVILIIKELITTTTNFGTEMIKASYATGLTTTQLQRWKAAGIETNVSFEGLVNTARMMTSRMGEVADGGSEMSKALKDIGVSAYDANGDLKSTDALMWDIVEGLAKYPAGQERASKAIKILGRSWYELAPLIEKAEDAQKAYASADVIDPKKIEVMEKYGTAIDKASNKMSMWAVTIGEKLLPLIDGFFVPAIDAITAAVAEMAYQWDVAQYRASLFFAMITLQGAKFEALVTMGVPKRPEKTTSQQIPAGNIFMPDLKAQEEATKKAMESVTDAIKKQTSALKDLNDEKQRLADLDKDYLREMSIVGWDVSRARELTIRHGWAVEDQKGKVGQAAVAAGQAAANVAGAMLSIGGNLILQINGSNKTLGQIVNEGQDLAKQRIVAGYVS